MTRTTLIVSSNADSGAGSLRQALAETQKNEGGQYEIVFQSTAQPNNSLTTGFFTIALKSPLPVIYRNDVQINVTSPRSVILVPEQASKSPNASSGLMNSSDPGRVNGSLLYVGDTNYLYDQKTHYKGSNLPNVTINNVSFIRNNAKGGDGSAGSGGGLGTGGAITLLAGDLEVTNSIFQGLKAEGGTGGRANKGGHGSVFNDVIKRADAKKGDNGGKGGVSSIPIRADSSGSVRFGEFAAAGGGGGAPGKGNNICTGDQGSKHDGKAGAAGASTSVFGMGGGGGGAGGGGAWNYDNNFSCFLVPVMTVHRGGSGGAGGRGGAFAGGGGRGGSGGRGNFKNLFGAGPANGGPSSGSNGGNGESIGAAIAIWGGRAQSISGENISANLSLDNVSFYNNTATRNEVFSDTGNFITINNVFDGSGRNNRNLVTVNSHGFGGPFLNAQSSSSANNPPIYYGLSVPRVESVADVSDTILQASDLPDQFYIGVEDRSKVAGITTDLTNENNPLTKIWRQIVPDESNEILEDYQAKANQSYTDAMFTTERRDKILKSLAQDAIGSTIKGVTKSFNPTGFGASTVSSAITDFAEDHIKYMNEKVMLERNRDEALEENLKKQDELARTLEEQSDAQLTSIQTDLQRTKVIIENFSLGNDSVTIPKGPNDAPIAFKLANNRGKTVVSMEFDTGSNADLPFLSIELDRQSTNALTAHAINASPQQYISSMLVDNDNKDKLLLGTKVALPLTIEGDSFSSGPAGTTLVVDRLASSRSLDDRVSLNTSSGSDAIYGSDGFEVINTGSNEDIIFPGFGGDDVNGGPGSDLVSYVLRPMSEAAPEAVSLVAKADQSIQVSKKGSSEGTVGRLRNIEDFHLFGDSTVDLRALTDESLRSIISGSGSNLTGSDGNEVFQISYYEDYNDSVKDAYAASTIVDGGNGFDRLIVDTENAPFDVGLVHDGEDLVLFREFDDAVLLFASGIESFAGTARALDRDISDFEKPSVAPPDDNDDSDGTPGDGGSGTPGAVNPPVTNPPATSGGTSGNDLLVGTTSKDTLEGFEGSDTLIGGLGNDILKAGDGPDVLIGGPGKDFYDLRQSDGFMNVIVLGIDKDRDKIKGFDALTDSILFSEISEFSTSTDKPSRAKRAGHNVILKVSSGKKAKMFYQNDESSGFSKVLLRGSNLDQFDLGSLLNSDMLDVVMADSNL